jgi:predicted amidohydrolase
MAQKRKQPAQRPTSAGKRQRRPVADTSLKIADVLELLQPTSRAFWWPPDAFAVVGTLLHLSGAYIHAVNSWPPLSKSARASAMPWEKRIKVIGLEWRRSAALDRIPPKAVRNWWGVLVENKGCSVREIPKVPHLCDALVNLCAAADEASYGIGVPSGARSTEESKRDRLFDIVATDSLLRTSTLCRHIDSTRLRVLPKCHTPGTGMTVRSLTHNLALCRLSDVEAEWRMLATGPAENRGLNALILPWPTQIRPTQFRQVDGALDNMPDRFGFFVFEPEAPPNEDEFANDLQEIVDEAIRQVGTVDLICFPELALTPSMYERARRIATGADAMLIAGVCEPKAPPRMARNLLQFDAPLLKRSLNVMTQQKHHRWKLDKHQIVQYGLGSSLSHTKDWWEHIPLDKRTVTFVAVNPWLTIAALICEDLARQDPAAELVRSVGPNLLIALLMDGPQLADRWPARYATVLADDPGCSVLTVTSLGMSELSRPKGMKKSRVVALWKDAKTGTPTEIELPEAKKGVVLTLSAEYHTEWTADGRADSSAGYPVLTGVHYLD